MWYAHILKRFQNSFDTLQYLLIIFVSVFERFIHLVERQSVRARESENESRSERERKRWRRRRGLERGRKRILHPLVQSPKGRKIWAGHMKAKSHNCYPRHVSRKLDWKLNSQGSNQNSNTDASIPSSSFIHCATTPTLTQCFQWIDMSGHLLDMIVCAYW